MANRLFSVIAGNSPNRNLFDLSHERKFSMNMGELIPILCEETLPGDEFKINTEVLLRMAPMLAPIMHRVNVYTHYFFVPNRLIWDEWEDFITGGVDGEQAPVMPYKSIVPQNIDGTLIDYLGISRGKNSGSWLEINSLAVRAYWSIFKEYYRDQNLMPDFDIPKTSGADTFDEEWYLSLGMRCWEKDYFTSALPWTQRGGDVSLPLTGNAPVVLSKTGVPLQKIVDASGNPVNTAQGVGTSSGGTFQTDDTFNAWLDPNGTMEADLSAVNSTTVEELRRATKLQQWLERNARGGSRYIEQIFSHFGVKSSDARLQRPEYLGGGKSPAVISEVLQTSSTNTDSPQANMAGHGVSVGNSHSFKKRFEEHGYVIGIMSVMPKTSYQQGTRRHFMKNDKFDYYWPEFAQLGEQPVYTGEIYAGEINDKETFGYQSRYSEYKYIPSSVHGEFKNTLSYWHMGRIFSSKPNLNDVFVSGDPTERIFAVQDGGNTPKLYVQTYTNFKAIRPIPKFNNPSLL